jgi:hypothetical protein
MQRIAAAALLLLALGSAGVAPADYSDRRARPSALRALETLNVPVTSDPKAAVTTRTALRKGAS